MYPHSGYVLLYIRAKKLFFIQNGYAFSRNIKNGFYLEAMNYEVHLLRFPGSVVYVDNKFLRISALEFYGVRQRIHVRMWKKVIRIF